MFAMLDKVGSVLVGLPNNQLPYRDLLFWLCDTPIDLLKNKGIDLKILQLEEYLEGILGALTSMATLFIFLKQVSHIFS